MKGNNRPLTERVVKIIWTTCRRIATKSKKGTNTIRFFARNNILVGCMVTYSRILLDVKSQKKYPIRVWITVRGNLI